jgi:hypothetical protein
LWLSQALITPLNLYNLFGGKYNAYLINLTTNKFLILIVD